MRKFVCAIFFTMLTFTYSLKLLVNEDYVEDDDEAWESDIEFSYKPFKGRCQKDGSNPAVTTGPNDDYDGSACNGYNGALPDGKGCMTKKTCATGFTPDEQAKYCTFPAGTSKPGITYTLPAVNSGSKIWAIAATMRGAAWWQKWKWGKFCHYVAKLASMSNVKVTTTSRKIQSFALGYAAGYSTISETYVAMQMYTGTSNGGVTDATGDWVCYTKAGMAWAKNDPKVKNMDGDEFEIMATGTFSLLSLKQSSSLKTVLEASATIDRAGTRCGATYIQNLTLSGQWVEDIGAPRIEIKAEAAVPKVKALQVSLDGNSWQHATSWRHAAPWTLPLDYPDTVQTANALNFVLKLNRITVKASVDAHRIHEGGAKTNRFANFLNVDFQGFSNLVGVSVGGLLGEDSHEDATKLPEGCDSAQLESNNVSNQYKQLSHVNVA